MKERWCHTYGEVGLLCWRLLEAVKRSKGEVMNQTTVEHLFFSDSQLPVCSYVFVKQQAKQKKKSGWETNKQTNKLAYQTHSHQGASHSKFSATHKSPTYAVLRMRPVLKEYRFLGHDAVLSVIILPHYKGNCCLHLPRFLFVGYSQTLGRFFDWISVSVWKCRSSVCAWAKEMVFSPVLWSASLSFVDTSAGPVSRVA